MRKPSPINILAHGLLLLMAANFNFRPSLKKYMQSRQGWIDFTVGIKTRTNSVAKSISFHQGKVSVFNRIPDDVDVEMIFLDDGVLKDMLTMPPNEVLNLLLKSKMTLSGNLAYLQLFNFYISLLLKNKHIKMMEQQKKDYIEQLKREMPVRHDKSIPAKQIKQLKAESVDPGVKYLDNPYLARYGLKDFPRLEKFLDVHFSTKPSICHERPLLLTKWFIQNGFEATPDGKPWVPELRQAHAFKHLMEKRKPIIRDDDLLAGTTTTKEIGVVLYPDAHGTMIWGELLTAPYRQLNPYDISPETVEALHHSVFPFWAKRNFREWVRDKYSQPLCQELDERFAVYFMFKNAAFSHTICDYPKLLRLGTKGIIREIDQALKKDKKASQAKQDNLAAMELCLEGLNVYANNLSKQALKDSEITIDRKRKTELKKIAAICARVPENPCKTLDEAVNVIWITWVAVHMENTNAGFSLGRLDQWLQPYFTADIDKYKTKAARQKYIKHAIELIGCLYMRCTDHLPLVPDIGNYLFGGSSSDQAITLGGVTPEGENAVNDMTYIFLKVTEMLGIRDPNVNARFNREKNSETYLKRLCEVNLITKATPSLHNDVVVMQSLAEFNYPPGHLRDWSATGCVEPTISGKHMGHTNCMMMNMVAALEMALNNGCHPLMRWHVGPRTGDVSNGDFKTFDDFFDAFRAQYRFLIEQSIEYNNILGEAHSVLRPTPFISALIDGCIEKGEDVTRGGARYNTSGSACIGLADVTDSLMAVKKLVFDEGKVSFAEIKQAVNTNFVHNPALHAMVKNKVPLFGSDSDEAVEIANRIARFTHECYGEYRNFRGGKYTAGFWSMSNHVAFGTLSGALPSGKLAGKAFTPGLTPQAHASNNLLDNIHDVSRLDPAYINNNIAFNVKVVPSAKDSHAKIVDTMYSYVKTYCDLGGMQLQFNVVSTDTLKDAMVNPENYKNLLVRISGYNAYFVTLNRDMQLELIERAEYGL